MATKIFLIHGWSVKTTQTYQALHLKLAEQGYQLEDIYLGRYLSLENHIEIRDIAKAMHRALQERITDWSQPFHLITHSTGGMVAKYWILNHYKGNFSKQKPLKNVVFLAAPHFGSRLAHHGRTMLGEIMELGETGKKILESLELGSAFSWDVNEQFFNASNWKDKGIRLYSLIGDRVKTDFFKSKIFPAAFENGSDMVIRVAAGNQNFIRYRYDSPKDSFTIVNEVKGIAFGALYQYTHSNDEYGILNSIKKSSTIQNHQAFRLIVECLKVSGDKEYENVLAQLAAATKETREKRQGYAQLDFRFRDDEGFPIDDYVVELGAIVNGKPKPSKTVDDVHKNKITPNHLTVFINLKELEPNLKYFINIKSISESSMYSYDPAVRTIELASNEITKIIREDHTTQIDVILSRTPAKNLFVFHRGDDEDLHVSWSRYGETKNTKQGIK